MPAAILGPVAGAVVGGLMGGDSQQSQSQSREPWAPAQPWLRQNLQTGQNLQNYYQQNPFNSIQRTSYQNLLGDIDNYRNVNPGLMAFANRLMNTNYSRNGGQGGGMGGGSVPQGYASGQGSMGAQSAQGGSAGGGLLGSLFDQQMAARGAPNANMGSIEDAILRGGLLGDGATMASGSGLPLGPFSAAPGGTYGAINWQETNPFTATNGIRADTKPAEEDKPKSPEDLAEEERRRRIQSGEGYRGEGA